MDTFEERLDALRLKRAEAMDRGDTNTAFEVMRQISRLHSEKMQSLYDDAMEPATQ